MTQYIYPQNLKATANLWLWGLRDFVILAVTALLSVLALVQLRIFLPAAAVLCYGFLTIRMDDTTVLNFMKGLNGYTLCSGIICEQLNGSEYRAIPLSNGGVMRIGYIQRRGSVLSQLGELYLQEVRKSVRQ